MKPIITKGNIVDSNHLAAISFKDYPEALVKSLLKNDAGADNLDYSDYYQSRYHDKLSIYPFIYTGNNLKKTIQDIICDVNSNIVFESIKNCRWSSVNLITGDQDLNEEYSAAKNVTNPIFFNFKITIDGKKYGFSLRWETSNVKEKYHFSKYIHGDGAENRIKLLTLAEEVREMLSNTAYAKELSIQSFVDMCRGKNV